MGSRGEQRSPCSRVQSGWGDVSVWRKGGYNLGKVTARWKGFAQASEHPLGTLRVIYSAEKDYLINHEPGVEFFKEK